MKTYDITIDKCATEGEEFCEWLISQGHTAEIGNSTGNYVDGIWCGADAEAGSIMNSLWDKYCNS